MGNATVPRVEAAGPTRGIAAFAEGREMLKEFRSFLLRGNVVDLAIAVVIGAAFGAVVTAMVDDLIMPIIGIFGGSPDFSSNTFTINGSLFKWGDFITKVISFIIIAAAKPGL